jgi:hypothetical protein
MEATGLDIPPAATDARGRRPLVLTRWTTAVTLVLGAVLTTIASALNDVMYAGDPDDLRGALVQNTETGLTSVYVNAVGVPLLLLGFTGVMMLSAHRAPVLSRIGWAILAMGLVGYQSMLGSLSSLYGIILATRPQVPETVFVSLEGGGPEGVWSVAYLIGMGAGVILCAISLLRSRVVPVWAALALLAFPFLEVFLSSFGWYVTDAVLVVFAIRAALAVLRSPRDSW